MRTMDKRTVSLARRRIAAVSLAAILIALGALCLAVLVSAQSPPGSLEETSTALDFAETPTASLEETSTALDFAETPTATLQETPPALDSAETPTATVEDTPPALDSAETPTATLQETPLPLDSAETPVVSVGKTASPDTVYHGDTVKYTAVFTNNTDTAINVMRITDTLPIGFMYVSLGSGSDIPDEPGGTSEAPCWDLSTHPLVLPAYGTKRLVYNVKAFADPNPNPYTNQLQALLSTGGVVSDSTPVYVVAENLTMTKSASSSQVPKGSTVDYTVTIHNDGIAVANLSAITDTLPASFTFFKMVSGPLPPPTVQGHNLIWASPISIPPWGQLQFRYRVTVDGTIGHAYQNSVRAAHNGEIVGPKSASVTVKKPKVYLPLVAKPAAPAVVYRLAYDYKPEADADYEIWAVDADGSNRVDISNESDGDLDPDWSPNGTKIAWVHYYDGKGDILVANADGSSKTNLTNHPKDDRAPDWSPDGTKIAFYSYRTDRWEVYVMNADGSNVTELTSQTCQSHDPVWSPDGTKIAFICGLKEYAEVYVMNANGSDQTRLTEDSTSDYLEDMALSWSPDSTRLVFVKYYNKDRNKGNIYVVDVNTKVVTQLTDKDSASHSPQWSPDGTKIAFSTYLDDSYEIATMSPDGTNVVNLTGTAKGDYTPRWSVDGHKISFISNRDGQKELYVMNADGSGQSRLTTRTGTGSDITSHEWRP
jgi:uncharacterized repeat protein (TIGR01451 family)